jgi:soluble lytic murein transglycosylase-like protein
MEMKNKMKHIIQAILIAILLFLYSGNMTYTEADVKNEKLYIIEKVNYWTNYWANYYKLNDKIDPLTKEKITKRYIENIVFKMIKLESRGDPNSKVWEKSLNCYSYGLLSLVPSTAKHDLGWNFKKEEELFDIDKNLKYGIKYLCKQTKRYNGSVKRGIASYNAGGVYYAKGSKGKYYINQKYVDIVYYDIYNYGDIKYKKIN